LLNVFNVYTERVYGEKKLHDFSKFYVWSLRGCREKECLSICFGGHNPNKDSK